MKLITHKRLRRWRSSSKLSFGTTGDANWPVWDRFLLLDDAPLMHIGNICGTCEFFFRHVGSGRVSSTKVAATKAQLDAGIGKINRDALALQDVVPAGKYSVALFEAKPVLVNPGGSDDYFIHEQRLSWERDPHDVSTAPPYYRCGTRVLKENEKLFEFMIPLQDPGTLNPERVEHYRKLIRRGQRPTAAAIGVLDVKSSMEYPSDAGGNEIVPDFPVHWCLAHYLIDGHHKVAAAAAEAIPITLLSFITREHSMRNPSELLDRYD